MIGIETLNNKGIQFIGDESTLKKEKKTLVVIGVARGGTSLVAGALDHLGVFGGDMSIAPVFEDVRLANAYEKSKELSVEIIEEYNKYSVWYYKRPAVIDYFDKINSDLQYNNPIYLIIFKDIFAVSNRNNISMKADIIQGLNNAYLNYGKILNIINNNNINGILLSYEKIMQNKDFFIEQMVALIGKDNITKEQRQSALNFIEPNPKAYLDASRNTKSIGRIGLVDKSKVIGWAKYLYSDKAVEVELYINNKLYNTTLAKDFRQNILNEGKHPNGYCGYIFDLTNIFLEDDDIISVKVKDDIMYLNGSNKKIKEWNINRENNEKK